VAALERQWLHEIGRAFGKGHVSIQFTLAQHCGIVPVARRRSPLTLILAEREDISRGIASGSSIRAIAKGLRRAVSTVSGRWRAMVAYRKLASQLTTRRNLAGA